jgi:hypothetical protein
VSSDSGRPPTERNRAFGHRKLAGDEWRRDRLANRQHTIVDRQVIARHRLGESLQPVEVLAQLCPGDEGARTLHAGDQALGPQQVQRLSNRVTTDTQLGGQRRFRGQRRPGRCQATEGTFHDLAAQHIADPACGVGAAARVVADRRARKRGRGYPGPAGHVPTLPVLQRVAVSIKLRHHDRC